MMHGWGRKSEPPLPAASTWHAGLGAAATRSLQSEFDDAVGALQLATDALAARQAQLAAVAAAAAAGGEGEDSAAAALAGVRAVLAGEPGAANVLPALQARLAEWQQRVGSHSDPSRILRWTGSSSRSGGGGGDGGGGAGATSGAAPSSSC